MSSTKRKFNALLDGLGSRPAGTVSIASSNDSTHLGGDTSASTDSGTKKPRLNYTSPNTITSGRLSTSLSSRIDRSVRTMSTIGTKIKKLDSSDAPKEAPKYTPWDRDAFYERLKSFRDIVMWTPKPDKVNEVEWAKRGWVCGKYERVRCCNCNVELLVGLNKKNGEVGKEDLVIDPQAIEEELVNKYAEMIITAHDKSCLWRSRGCDDTIFKLPLNQPAVTLANLKSRYENLCSMEADLPYSHNMKPPGDLDIESVIKYLPKAFFTLAKTSDDSTGTNITSTINRVALLLAICGWDEAKDIGWNDRSTFANQIKAGTCNACFRRIGFWLYKSKKVDEEGREVEPPTVHGGLDPVDYHRSYCPWSNPDSQSPRTANASSTEQLAAWQVVVRSLKNDHILRERSNSQASKASVALSRPASRPATRAGDEDGELSGYFGTSAAYDEDAKSIREEKDKQRWSRLKKVKSLFDTKASRKKSQTSLSDKAKAQEKDRRGSTQDQERRGSKAQ